MTVSEILEQAKALSPDEREQLIHELRVMQADSEGWTDEELDALLTIEPMTGAEIVAAGLTGGWKDLDIPDGARWVNEQRQKRRKRHQ